MQRWFHRCLLLCFVVATTACSDPNRAMISGTVKVDGQPAAEGSIAFFPTDGKATTTGGVIQEGKYSAEAQPGNYRVEIRVAKKVGEQKLYDTPDSPVQPIMQESLPPKYNDRSELEVEVVSGDNTHDFDLQTRQ